MHSKVLYTLKTNEMKTKAKLMYQKDSILLVVDMQERLIKAITKQEKLIFNIKKLVEAAYVLGINIVQTEQNPKKLGKTIKELEIRDCSKSFEKMSFSCCGSIDFVKFMENQKIKNVLICGIESHVCVEQTSIELLQLGYNVFIAADATGSRNLIDHDIAIRRIENSGAIITSTEGAIFEWCKTAEREEFKPISSIIKKSI
tara:strand:+ start:612 stop:1214 length:603 start_codon:yes stop_codon:yes gene_type:complete